MKPWLAGLPWRASLVALGVSSSYNEWGLDLRLVNGQWSNQDASRYQRQHLIRDARQLRLNGYRVLLTRARDAVVVFVPTLPELDETYAYLVDAGFRLSGKLESGAHKARAHFICV